MDTFPKIQFVSQAKIIKDLHKEVELLTKLGLKSLRLYDQLEIAAIDYQNIIESSNLQLVVDYDLSQRIQNNLPRYYKLSEMDSFKKEDTLTIGQAYSIADCLNWELKSADYIDFRFDQQPKNTPGNKSILGSEALQTLIPATDEYGWMLLSINTPILVSGITSIKMITDIVKTTNVYGVALDHDFPIDQLNLESVQVLTELLQ